VCNGDEIEPCPKSNQLQNLCENDQNPKKIETQRISLMTKPEGSIKETTKLEPQLKVPFEIKN
jgi:hypothetical protein